MTQFFVDQLDDEEKQIVCSSINVYGDGQHPLATSEGLHYFKLPYVAHCLGRQHYAVIGAELMKAEQYQNEKHVKLHAAHDAILDKILLVIELGPTPNNEDAEKTVSSDT